MGMDIISYLKKLTLNSIISDKIDPTKIILAGFLANPQV